MSPVKVYFINLDGSTGRRQALEADLAATGLPFERVPGVRGDALPDDLKPYFRAPDGSPPPFMTRGEIGCFAAHLAVYRRFLADPAELAPVALVLEDDAAVPAGFADTLATLVASMPADGDMLRISNPAKYGCAQVATTGGGAIVKYSRVPANTRAYLLTRAGARKLLALRFCDDALDDDLRHPWRTGLNQYGIVPPLIGQRAVASDLDGFGRRVFPRPTLRQRWRRADLLGWPRRVAHQVRWLGFSTWLRLTTGNLTGSLRRRVG